MNIGYFLIILIILILVQLVIIPVFGFENPMRFLKPTFKKHRVGFPAYPWSYFLVLLLLMLIFTSLGMGLVYIFIDATFIGIIALSVGVVPSVIFWGYTSHRIEQKYRAEMREKRKNKI